MDVGRIKTLRNGIYHTTNQATKITLEEELDSLMSHTPLSFLRIRNIARNAEFMERASEKWNIVDRSNELAGECGEVANVCKKIRRHQVGMTEEDMVDLRAKLEEELADVMICADLVAMEFNINLGKAISEKFDKSSDKFGLLNKFFQ